MSSLSLRLEADVSAMSAVLGELSALVDTGQIPLEIGDRLVRAIEAGAEAFVFKVDRLTAAGADQLVVRAQPSDLLLRFMSAARAGDSDLSVIEDALRHIEFSIGLSAQPMVSGAGSVEQ